MQRKFLNLLLVALLLAGSPQPAYASLTFGAASSDRVDCGSDASLDNLDAYTVIQWIYPTTQTGGRRPWSKGLDNAGKDVFWVFVDTNDLNFFQIRATTNANARTSINIPTNAWLFVVFTYDNTDGPRVFTGNLTTAPTEASYFSRTVGSGVIADDSGESFLIGNRDDVTTAFQGRIARTQVFTKRMVLGEITQQWMDVHNLAESVLWGELGFNGTSTQTDLSGTGNSCTVTGATVADHAPLPQPF